MTIKHSIPEGHQRSNELATKNSGLLAVAVKDIHKTKKKKVEKHEKTRDMDTVFATILLQLHDFY